MGQFSTDATFNVGEDWGHAGGSNQEFFRSRLRRTEDCDGGLKIPGCAGTPGRCSRAHQFAQEGAADPSRNFGLLLAELIIAKSDNQKEATMKSKIKALKSSSKRCQ